MYRLFGWLALAITLLLGGVPAATAAPTEYQVKAVFLFNFSQFVEWPPQAFAETRAPLVIGVLGDDPFGATLDDIVRGESVNGRPLVVHRFKRVADIDVCHILFVSKSERARLNSILPALKGRPILTVSDADGFAQQGGMIRFMTERSRIRLRVNLEAATAAGLTISSKLLRPAEIVRTGEG